jgi:uncharacterized protein (UPF0332 family)
MKDEYQRVAERSLTAARVLLEAQIYEMATFCCYHAYESVASALATSKSKKHGPRVPHQVKLKTFWNCAETIGNNQMTDKIAQLNMEIGSLRNRLLYPREVDGQIKIPEDEVFPQQVEQLLEDVQVVVNWVGQKI